MHKLITSVLSEGTLQSTNPGIIVFAYPLKVRKFLFRFLIQVNFRGTVIVWFCSDEKIYGRSLLSEYTFFIKHRSIHGRLTTPWEVEKFIANKMRQTSASFTLALVSCDYLLKHCWFYSQWLAYKLVYLLDQLSSAVSPWWFHLKGCNLASPFICFFSYYNLMEFENCEYINSSLKLSHK